MTADILLAAREISRRYGARPALRGIDLTLRRGEILGLLGLNGAGKSTTLRILTGVIAPHAGTVSVTGIDLKREPERAKRALGYLPETPPLYPDASVDEFLSFCAELHRVPRPAVAAAVARTKARCGIAEVGPRLIRNLSKGYQQRVGIAQAILHDPPVLILDEPTVGLDPVQIREVRELIRELGRTCAVLLSTHILSEVQSLCSRVVVLHEGRIAYDESARSSSQYLLLQLRDPPQRERIAGIAGVTGVEALAADRFSLRTDDPDGVAERIAAAAVAQGWGLRELRREDTPLEQVFRGITRGGPALPPDTMAC